MKVSITYPAPKKQKQLRKKLVEFLKWPFLLTALICPVINLTTGGRAWSVIVLWSLWIAWSVVISPALVEYNRTSQLIKLIACSCLLLILIDLLLSPGWAVEAVPIVSFAGMIVSGIIFFHDMERQKQNMFPLLLLAGVSLVCSIVGLIVWRGEELWAMAVMGSLALVFLAACASILGPDFLRELKKRFHTR